MADDALKATHSMDILRMTQDMAVKHYPDLFE
jgi:hypothetical protein